ncbi:MAG: UPF0280 family protein [Clostridia bacterium]|nr:UPF0280 family protein [Clostridia bacterium]
MYEERVYRKLFKGMNLEFYQVLVGETDLSIGSGRVLYDEALKWVIKFRQQLETYIRAYPLFQTSLEPIDAERDAPEIVKKMCAAAQKAEVGPMAAVAGAISEMVGMELLKLSEEVIIENGGDLFIKTCVPRKVGIYAGNSPLSEKVALEIAPDETPIGICTSSGTVGHSLSFGKADAAVIVSRDTFLADAVATATGNRVKNGGDIEKGIEFAASINGVVGVVIIVGDKIGAWGDIKLVGV